MSTTIPWIDSHSPPKDYDRVLVLLNDKTVRYGYHGIKGWWIYSHSNGYVIALNVLGWKPTQ